MVGVFFVVGFFFFYTAISASTAARISFIQGMDYLLGHADNRLLGFVFSVSESCGELQN